MDTIFALATAPGRAGIAVVRISGPVARACVERLAGALPVEGRALRLLRDADGAAIDQALVLTFPEGRSFTGEEVVELHLHGSPAVVSAVLDRLAAMPGLRLAEAGEFTRRAFQNGRLDLAEVEGLADLIEAETEAQRRAALRQMTGGMRHLVEDLRIALIRAAALLEATIDFVDEEVPVDVGPEVQALLGDVARRLRREIDGFGAAERLRQGFEVVILGHPNAGKSTLLNAIAGREAAITSAHAGTTRDLIEVRMDLRGVPVTLVDTAGLRESDDEVERIGVSRALARGSQADLCLVLLDETGSFPDLEGLEGVPRLVVQGKADLVKDPGEGEVAVSGLSGEGVDSLIHWIESWSRNRVSAASQINRQRHLVTITAALASIETAISALSYGSSAVELVAEEVRTALRQLDGLIGRVDVEMVLDEIFSSFCIGK